MYLIVIYWFCAYFAALPEIVEMSLEKRIINGTTT
ncbi:hypothetical protein EZJ58_3586 [Sodalis ligni]|jgi:hypothetical protein|uniref:Uncharacterized protein n=1 Tax=Sodalis ligni TaxID=2697027 RepID=A0A4R1NCW9_9GAMM|nr:hypothetical protein EZJ58_3586 [Sodalis ligni]